MKRLAILGASGHGKVVADAALLSGWDEVMFYDDAWPELKTNASWPIVGNTLTLMESSERIDGIIVAVGNNRIRQEKSQALRAAGLPLATVIHPSAIVSQFSSIGEGCFVAASAVIHVDSTIGDYSIINTAAIVEHDCCVGEACHISPGSALAGAVRVGHSSWIGINSCVRQLVNIANNVVVGAGSTVIKNVPSGTTVVGNPAKPLINH